MDNPEENMIILQIMDAALPKSSMDANQMPETDELENECTVADYMKYVDTGGDGRCSPGHAKVKKSVSFKAMVVNVTFNENWEMQTSQSNLRTEDQQHKTSTYLMRNF